MYRNVTQKSKLCNRPGIRRLPFAARVCLVSVRVAAAVAVVLRARLRHHGALVAGLARGQHRLHVHQAHVLRVRDHPLGKEGLKKGMMKRMRITVNLWIPCVSV